MNPDLPTPELAPTAPRRPVRPTPRITSPKANPGSQRQPKTRTVFTDDFGGEFDGSALLAQQAALDAAEKEIIPISDAEAAAAASSVHPLFGAVPETAAVIETAAAQAKEARIRYAEADARELGFKDSEEVQAETKRASRVTRLFLTTGILGAVSGALVAAALVLGGNVAP